MQIYLVGSRWRALHKQSRPARHLSGQRGTEVHETDETYTHTHTTLKNNNKAHASCTGQQTNSFTLPSGGSRGKVSTQKATIEGQNGAKK